MILKNDSIENFAKVVKVQNKNIVIFGAGTILSAWFAFVLQKYEILNAVTTVIDNNLQKQGKEIELCGQKYIIKSLQDSLDRIDQETIVVITSSYFSAIVKQLDEISQLETTECFIAPVMHMSYFKEKTIEIPKDQKKKIPPVIHYCWFGKKEIPDKNKRCIDSWRKYCPNYEIVEWNESNYDVYKNEYMAQAYESGKFGYVPDFARIDLLYEHGGIYFDTDVELVRGIDDLLMFDAFTSFEEYPTLNFGGGSGAVKGFPLLKKVLNFREKYKFIESDGTFNLKTCGFYETVPLIEEGLCLDGCFQEVSKMTILPSDCFHTKSSVTGKVKITENTYGIHHFGWSWVEEKQLSEKIKSQLEYEDILERMNK